MTAFVALLRAINVGGAGKLAMKDLVALCEDQGFGSVKTYIQSGNVVFTSKLSEAKAQAKLQKALTAQLGKEAGVTLRTADELDAALAHNPFQKEPSNRVIVFFANDALPAKIVAGIATPGDEQLKVRGREAFVFYPVGLGRSKLKLPFAKIATGRNINTVTKLAAMARAIAA